MHSITELKSGKTCLLNVSFFVMSLKVYTYVLFSQVVKCWPPIAYNSICTILLTPSGLLPSNLLLFIVLLEIDGYKVTLEMHVVA